MQEERRFPSSDGSNRHFADGKQIGFIAQEVEKALPELVNTNANGYKSVAYANIVAILVEAVKRLNAMIEEKQKRIEALEKLATENADLRAALSSLAVRLTELETRQLTPIR